MLQCRQHAQPEQVELHQAHPRGVVLVPLDHGAALHPGVLDRHHLPHRTFGEHHARGVDAQVPRRLQQPDGLGHHRLGDVVLAGRQGGPPALDLPGERVGLARPVTQRPRHVPDRVLGPVLDDIAHLGRALPSVAAVDPLDDLLAAVGVEVDVDVGFLVPQRREEPLERQPVGDRVHRGDPQQVADRRVGGRPAALAQDAAPARLGDDVVHDQEVAGEVLRLDHGQFTFDPLGVGGCQVGVADGDRLGHQVPQPRHRRVPLGHLLPGQGRFGTAQREREFVGQLHRARHRPGVADEPRRHLLPRA